MPTIRPIRAADNLALRAILRADLEAAGLAVPGTAYTDPNLATLNEFYDAEPNRAYFVAVANDGTVLGGAGCAEFAVERGIAELQKLYLAPAAQGQGLSYQLIAAVTAFARQAGYQKLYLETHHNLQAAMHVYQRCGFQQVPQDEQVVAHGAMDRFYLKSL